MTLKPGTWLNHYEILAHIGSGGMGEVYRARDNKLQREVALKVLPEHFARDPERIARFRREAQVLAQLNHVNIAAIHTVEQSGDTHFLVMELAPGETLRDRIKHPSASLGTGSPVPLEEALDISKQIAAGLEHAHEKPIVHRDLKPANIKVTPEGVVKILDFGLARAFTGDTGSGDPADSPTLSAMTAPGTILGTAAYMSPEQARGKKVDKRTDIWALGCVLYELLTGKQAFQSRSQSRDREGAGVRLHYNGQPPLADARGSDSDRDTIADIIGAVLYKEPDWSALPSTTPHWVRVLLRRCLEKDAKRRLRDAADLQIQIEESLSAPATAAPSAALRVPERPAWRRAIPVILALAVVAFLAGLAVWNLRPTPAQPVTRFAVPLPTEERLGAIGGFNLDNAVIILSPDGTRLVYVARQLYLREMDQLESRPIPGTAGARAPFFSPDGQWVGFFADGKLKKVSISGGAPVTLCDAPLLAGGSWGSDDTIVFGRYEAGLWQVSAGGGTPQELTALDSAKGETFHLFPEHLPGGKAVVFAAWSGTTLDTSRIEVLSLETGERQVLIPGGTLARYVPTGHLVYAQAGTPGTLLAAPFDPERVEMTGAPVPILEGVMHSPSSGVAQFSFSRLGSLVYVPGGAGGAGRELFYRNGDRMMIVDITTEPAFRTGTPRLLFEGRYHSTDLTANSADYDVTPDGQRFVMIREGAQGSPAGQQLNVVLNWFEELKRRIPTGQ